MTGLVTQQQSLSTHVQFNVIDLNVISFFLYNAQLFLYHQLLLFSLYHLLPGPLFFFTFSFFLTFVLHVLDQKVEQRQKSKQNTFTLWLLASLMT